MKKSPKPEPLAIDTDTYAMLKATAARADLTENEALSLAVDLIKIVVKGIKGGLTFELRPE